jgi:hypothetical protein
MLHRNGIRQPQEYRSAEFSVLNSVTPGRRQFAHQGERARVLRAGAEALGQPQDDEQYGGADADGGVGGQAADEHGRAAHQGQRHDQRHLAAVLVAEVAEDDPAERAGQVPHAEGGERGQGPGGGRELREEQVRENQRRRLRVDEHVEPLEERPDEAGREYVPACFFPADAGSSRRGHECSFIGSQPVRT